jgi:hypothetical protein
LTVSITRTSKRIALAALIATGGFLTGGVPTRDGADTAFIGAAHARLPFKSTEAAYEQGLSAFRSGYFELAVPALEFVTTQNDPKLKLPADFYLGRIYADSNGAQTDHAKAYMFFQRIADEYADIDPDDLKRAPLVAKALTALALYVRDGLPEIGLKPDQERAVEYLRHAATFFNEPDAQFELAKINIDDERERRNALHFLQKLAKESHPGAQATLADLMARGKYVPQDRTQALALGRMAVENASPSDRLWIEHIYQNIYCGAPAEARERSTGLVANWRKLFTHPKSTVEQPGTTGRSALGGPARVCANGEAIDTRRSGDAIAVPGARQGGALSIMPSGVTGPPTR